MLPTEWITELLLIKALFATVLNAGFSLASFFIASLLFISFVSVGFSIIYFYNLNRHEGSIQADVTMILALTGVPKNFNNLLLRLNAQTLKPAQLLIGIESVDDPAYQLVMKFAAVPTFPVKVIIAGPSETTAQKCHNQLAAASLVSKGSQHHIVLLDADIDPPEWWLAALIKPLVNRTADVVSGYRWQQPKSTDLGAHFVAFIDRSIAILPKLKSAAMLWGGSIAMRKTVFVSVIEAQVLESTITDDLAIASYAKKMKFKLLMRRLMLVPSPTDRGLLSGFRFGVRQYQIIKIHRPMIWMLALIVSVLTLLGWFELIRAVVSKSFSTTYVYLLFCVYLCVVIKMTFLYKISVNACFVEHKKFWFTQFSLIPFKPFIDLFHCLMILRSAFARYVRWGYVTYLVTGISSIKVLKRNSFSNHT